MSNRKWNISIVILFIIFACLLLSFLFSALRIRDLVEPLTSIAADDDTELRIVLISQELDNPYWRSIEQGARAASLTYKMQLEYVGPFRINPAEQIKLLEKAITKKADAIFIQGIDDPLYRSLIDKALASGIPVIAVDTDEPGSKRISYVGTDNVQAGKEMGELVVQASGGQGQIGVLVGDEEAHNQQLRLEGFRSVIQSYPELTIVDVRSSEISRLQAAEQAEDMLLSHPQVGYLIGFSALDGLGMLEAAKRVQSQEVRIFAFDDLDETKAAIAQRKLTLSIVQQPYEMGYDAVSLLHDYLNGITPPKQHFTSTFVIDQSTIDAGSEAGGQ